MSDSELLEAMRWFTQTAKRDPEVGRLLNVAMASRGCRNISELTRQFEEDFWVLYDGAQAMVEQLPHDGEMLDGARRPS